jgi:hypothetical protein
MKFSAFLKSLVVLTLCSCLFFFVSSKSFAQTEVTQTLATSTTNTNSDVPNNLHNWTQTVMLEVMSSLSCQLTGIDPMTKNGQCLGFDQKTGKIGFLPVGNLEKGEIGGAIGGMNKMIIALYTPPFHTSDYFQNLAQNFGISKKTYAAAGTGFDSLSPLMNIWTAFRNIVYLILVVIFVIIGLAIMLRVKIDPRTVMTIQNQIPKIIVGILLVTFSFAIAGFLIDMMWVLMYLMHGLISGISSNIATNISQLNPTILQGKSPLEATGWDIFQMSGRVADSSKDIILKMLKISPLSLIGFGNIFDTGKLVFEAKMDAIPNFLIDLISILSGITMGSHWAQIIGDLEVFGFAIPTGTVAAAVAGFSTFSLTESLLRYIIPIGLVFIIIFVALFVALFRLWFILLMSYVSILLDVVLAPFWIIGGIIPGSQISFSGWLKDIAANLLAFPAVIFMFLVGNVFMDSFENAANPFTPPLIGNLGDPKLFSSLIGIGIILITPNVVNMLKQMLKAPKMESGLGRAIAPGTGILTQTTRGVGRTMMSRDEWIMGEAGWERRGLRRAIFGGLFGR